MLKLGVGKSGLVEMHQVTTAPFVYLDHWALDKIAKGSPDRFVESLQRQNGTLALSWINFLHISEASGASLDAAEALLRRLVPGNVVFIDVEAASVVRKEDALFRGESSSMPYLHPEWTELFFRWEKKHSLNPLHPDEFIEAFRTPSLRAGLRATYENGRAEIASMILEARRQAGQRADVLNRLKARPRREYSHEVPPTRYFDVLAMKYLIRGNQNIAGGDHVRDHWHTVVPISYCHYVALDKNWCEAVAQFQKVLRRARLLSHEAVVFRDHDALVAQLEGPAPPYKLWGVPRRDSG